MSRHHTQQVALKAIPFCLLCMATLFPLHKAEASPVMGQSNQEPYTLSICAIFQNEAQWLPEWIEYHRLIGVEHFFLYDNHSQDNFLEVLEPYIESGLVELSEEESGRTQVSSQLSAYNRCLSSHGSRSKWIAFLDVDEFLVPVYENDLREILRDYEAYGGVVANWQLFGTSDVERLVDGELLTQSLTWCCEEGHPTSLWVKTIARTAATKRAEIHNCIYHHGFEAVDTEKRSITGAHNTWVPLNRLRINHYYLRTRDWAYGEKLRRRREPIRDKYHHTVRYSHSETATRKRLERFERSAKKREDKTIQRFVPELQERMHQEQQRAGLS